jgi:hypothetical protein
LPPGQYTVEAAVVDHERNRASTRVAQIDNRERQGAGISDLALVRRLENIDRPPDATDPFEYAGKRVLPLVTADLSEGTRPVVYFMVYPEPGNPAKPELRVALLKEGRVLATRAPALPQPDALGGIPLVLEESSDPGSYEVRATVVQGDISTERRLAYTLAGNVRANVPSLAGEIPKPGPPPADDGGRTAGQSPDEGQLARFQEKVRRDFTGIPNYTCLETIERARRAPPSPEFKHQDTVRLEVSSVAGKELFAKPGAQRFEDRDVTSIVTGGTIGSGMFATIARNLFVAGAGALKYRGKQTLAGHASVRYDFRLKRQESGFKIQVANYSETWRRKAPSGSIRSRWT